MGLRAETLRKEYPDLTDEEVARAYALKNGYHVVVMYEDRGGLAFKGLRYDRELDEVRSSPYISDLRVVYDDRQVESFDDAETRAVERAREVFGEAGASHASTHVMKKCPECNAEVDVRASVCPKCGGENFVGDLSSMLASLETRLKAKEHVDRGGQLILEGLYSEGIAECKIAIECNPHNAVAHSNIGGALLRQGKTAEAIPWLKKALQLNPNLEGVSAALAEAMSAGSAQKSGCFVATACYGDPECPEVNVLRAYRDRCLSPSIFGRLAIRLYCACSPALASWLERHPRIRSAVREKVLNPLVLRLERAEGE